MELILDCISGAWSPAVGDPDAWGWAVVAAYGLATALCLRAAWRRQGREAAFWACAALLMAALGVNKQLDLQTLLTAAGRCVARAQGWYGARGAVQTRFVEAVAAVAALSLIGAGVAMRAHLARLWPAILGLAAVLTYVAVRAASFHHVDQILYRPGWAGIKLNPVLELAGALLIAANAGMRGRRRGRPRASDQTQGRDWAD